MDRSVQNLTREIHALFSANKLNEIFPYLHDDVVAHAHAFGATFNGKDGFMDFMQSFKSAFPDVSLTHRNMVTEGDVVAVEFTGEGTHTGPLQTPGGTLPPTGRKVIFTVCEVLKWENGKLRSLANYQDSGAIMRQLGLM